jgi:hypothetical protein
LRVSDLICGDDFCEIVISVALGLALALILPGMLIYLEFVGDRGTTCSSVFYVSSLTPAYEY